MSEILKTSTVGYFNPNEFPMQLIVSEYNLTINLKPKEWIFDRNTPARLVTDPVLDRYVGKNKLSRASDPKKIAETVRLVAVNAPPVPGQPTPAYRHAVTAATGFVKDPVSGQLKPVIAAPSAPVPSAAPPVSYNPVKGYSVADARRLKLIRPTKHISDDFGADESSTGAPRAGSSIPTIEYATDTTRPHASAEVVAQPITADQHGVLEGMTKGVAAVSPDAPDVIAATLAAMKENPNAVGASAQPAPLPVMSEAAARVSGVPPIPTHPTPTEIVEGPDPAYMIVEEEIEAPAPIAPAPAQKPATRSPVPKPPADEALAGKKPPTVAGRSYKCPKCSVGAFNSPGYFKRHVNRYHTDEAAALIAQVVGA